VALHLGEVDDGVDEGAVEVEDDPLYFTGGQGDLSWRISVKVPAIRFNGYGAVLSRGIDVENE
jgi:hypothetical protein